RILAAEPALLRPTNLGATRFDLLGVLMANVDEPLRGVSDESSQYHRFDNQVRCPQEEFAIFKCAWFALITIHHNKCTIVFFALASFSHGVANIAPLLNRWNSRAT